MFLILAGKQTDEIEREINEWIRQGEDGQRLTPETYPDRVLFIGMMNEIPISSKEPKGGKSAISARRVKKCSLFREVEAQICHVHWSRSRTDLFFF